MNNAHDIRVMVKFGGVIVQVKPPEKPRGMKKDRTVLGRLDQMMRLDGIRLDGLS